MPEGDGSFLPYNWEDSTEAIDVYLNYGFLDLMRKATAKHGVYYLVPISVATTGLVTKKPVYKCQDLKGMKIRAAGMEGLVVQALGALPVSIPGAEQYVALQRGTVDGTYYPWYTIEDYKLFEVIDYVILPATHTPAVVDLLIGKKVWDKLSSDNKKALDRAGMETMWRSFLYGEVKDKRAEVFCKEKGIKFIKLPPEEHKHFKEAAMKVYESHAKRSDLCARQVEIIKKYWKEKGR